MRAHRVLLKCMHCQFFFLLLPRKCQVSSGMRFAMFRPAPRRLRSLVARSGVGVRSIASSATAAKLFGSLRAPIIGAPLFIVSNPDLVIAQCKVCAWPVRGLCAARARRVRGACAYHMYVSVLLRAHARGHAVVALWSPCRRASSVPSRRSTRGPRTCSTSGSPRSRPISPSTAPHTPTGRRHRLRSTRSCTVATSGSCTTSRCAPRTRLQP